MYVYRNSNHPTQQVWEVGYYYLKTAGYPYDGQEKTYWYCESKYTNQDAAIAKTSYLNGGEPIFSWLEETNLTKQQTTQELREKLEAVPDLDPTTTHIDDHPTKEIDIDGETIDETEETDAKTEINHKTSEDVSNLLMDILAPKNTSKYVEEPE